MALFSEPLRELREAGSTEERFLLDRLKNFPGLFLFFRFQGYRFTFAGNHRGAVRIGRGRGLTGNGWER